MKEDVGPEELTSQVAGSVVEESNHLPMVDVWVDHQTCLLSKEEVLINVDHPKI